MNPFSFSRWWGIVLKEFLQLRRDKLTFGMIIIIPIVQLILFGYAINMDPKHLKTGVIIADDSQFSRSVLASLHTSNYYHILKKYRFESEGQTALAKGEVQFVVNIPADFSQKLLRHENPTILMQADATDPAATSNAISALPYIVKSVSDKDFKGSLSYLASPKQPFTIAVQRMYNPEGITQYNIIPGLMGLILTMTMVMMTGLAMTRERERGTMENLLATPALPIEVMTGKIFPYIFIGLVQATIILLAARYAFNVPLVGSVIALFFSTLLFIAANLTVGITFSSLAENQLQAVQLTFFYFLPNILLSGFMFPFYGMPHWAQNLGNLLPMTYFNRLTRGIFLKGNSWIELWTHMWPLMIFTLIVMMIALKFYRRTLD